MRMSAKLMSDEQAVNLLRNALVIAGQEMGHEGDHWPVIKATAFSIADDYEKYKVERSKFEDVKKRYSAMIKELEEICERSPEEEKPEIRMTIVNLLEIYNASFSPVSNQNLYMTEDNKPEHLKRADVILKALEDEHA